MVLTQKQKDIIERLGFTDAIAFLNYYPYRYDYLETKPYESWEEKDKVVFSAVLASDFKKFRYGRNQAITNFSVLHEGVIIKCSLFNRPFVKQSDYTEGLVVVGTVGKNKGVNVQLISNKPIDTVLGIKPIYGLKAGIKNFEITRLVQKILKDVIIETVVPYQYRDSYHLMERADAVREVHCPQNETLLKDALRTLKYEEFLKYHLNYALNHEAIRKGKASQLRSLDSFPLPFDLNIDQAQAVEDIRNDMSDKNSMSRMLQGDVGSGKTIVAFLSMLSLNVGQAALLVPTETLAIQHYQNFKRMFPRVSIALLTQDTENKEEILAQLKDGTLSYVIGTHALFQKTVRFKNLRLAIVDEQHRFGVDQRQMFYNKGEMVDVLMLSATPIPRTLASSLFFDMSVSTLESHPQTRRGSQTHLVEENSLRSIIDPINEALAQKQQIYVVCPAIDTSARAGVKTVVGICEQLTNVFKNASLAVLHGNMSSEEKKITMKRFEEGAIDVLICTTVIEVGVDVHNATIMIIYNAELFGLATLHQLRGRVGRGSVEGHTYLLSNAMEDEITKERLTAMLNTNSGFELSMMDLRLRGFGDLLGARQSGMPHFILGDIINDEAILLTAKKDAHEILQKRDLEDNQAIIRSLEQFNPQF